MIENHKNYIPTKWTLFLQEHWCAKDLVKELAPAYYFKELENYSWNIELENISKPGHFINLNQSCDSFKAIVHFDSTSKDRSEKLFLIRDFFLFQDSLFRLLPKNMRELIQKEFRPDFVQSFLQSLVEKELHSETYTEETKNRNLLWISL